MITLAEANAITAAIIAEARRIDCRPIAVIVTELGGYPKAFQKEDGCSMLRFEMAHGKAFAALSLGRSSALVRERGRIGPEFLAQVDRLGGNRFFAVGGGEQIRNAAGQVIGAVGVTGPTEAQDEALALHGIRAAGLLTDQDCEGMGRIANVRLTPNAEP